MKLKTFTHKHTFVTFVIASTCIIFTHTHTFVAQRSRNKSHLSQIEKDVGINITMVGVDECLYEYVNCEGSCTNVFEINALPYTVNANKTALVGVRVDTYAECTCGARNFSKTETCRSTPCLNGGRCTDTRNGPACECPGPGYGGPRCQQTARSFKGSGWAWYSPLDMCDDSHLSLEFVTRKADGLMLYNGPIVPPEPEETLVSGTRAITGTGDRGKLWLRARRD